MSAVRAQQRFTRQQPCPICGGYEALPRGHQQRCYGFLSETGEYAFCTREELAANLPYQEGPEGWAHKLQGLCNCGTTHGSAVPSTPAPSAKVALPAGAPKEVYRYCDEEGRPLFEVARFEPKSFRQRRAAPGGGWTNNIEGVRRVLYRLRDLVQSDPSEYVFICEGEKDTDRLRSCGLVATTAAMGAGKWREEYNASLAGRSVIIPPDNDDAGHAHAQDVARNLHGTAASVKVLELPGTPGADVSDWLDNGHSVAELRELAAACPEWEPEAQQVAKEHLAGISAASTNGDRPSDTPPPDLSRLPDACYRFITEDYLRAVVGVTEASDAHHYFLVSWPSLVPSWGEGATSIPPTVCTPTSTCFVSGHRVSATRPRRSVSLSTLGSEPTRPSRLSTAPAPAKGC